MFFIQIQINFNREALGPPGRVLGRGERGEEVGVGGSELAGRSMIVQEVSDVVEGL